MIGFDNGSEQIRYLDGKAVQEINADLTDALDFTKAMRLHANSNIAFAGTKKYGPFDIDKSLANTLIAASDNLNHRSNIDVVKPWVNGSDIVEKNRGMWIIDFGVDMSCDEAAEYNRPFEYVNHHVKPEREKVRRERTRRKWWLFEETRSGMRRAIGPLQRFIVTPAVAKHRPFVWLAHPTIPDQQLIVIAREDDYFLGVLHSLAHELWSLRLGTSLGPTPRYTPTTTFETFPFPWSPGSECQDDPRVQAIAAAARDLVSVRDAWLGGAAYPDLPLEKRTLTNLYNARPDWLDAAHRQLDAAVLDAYGWPHDIADEDILARLLALNLERAAGQGGVEAQALEVLVEVD
jgi:type II restriction/modification system DNA methylase subunit YeeA